MKFHEYCVVIPVVVVLQAGLSAQSLADVAKAEEARRKTIKTGVKVYTNEDLGRTPTTSAAPAQPASVTTASAKPVDPAKPGEEKPADPTKTQAYWKERATTLQQSLSRNKLLLEALQSQVNGLNAVFVSMDDPGQRDLLQARLQRASGEMQRVQQDIEKQTKAAAALQDEARKAGVPAGWVR
jgi:type IV secretory pathway VirB10-like protein